MFPACSPISVWVGWFSIEQLRHDMIGAYTPNPTGSSYYIRYNAKYVFFDQDFASPEAD